MIQDVKTKGQIVLKIDQGKISEGKFWSFGEKISLLAGATQYYMFDPGEKRIRAKPFSIITSVDKTDLKFYSNSATTANGTEMEVWNHNQSKAFQRKQPHLKAYRTPTVQLKIVDGQAGGNFGNQPTGDIVQVLSDNVADIGQKITIYGTRTGATTTITAETVTLNGTTAVDSTTITWQNILAVEMGSIAAGTVTIRKKTGAATITTLLTTVLSAGVATLTGQNYNGAVPSIVANGATTAPVGIYGRNKAGALISVVQALNGNTPQAAGTGAFYEVEKVFIGAVASARTVDSTTTRPGLPFSDGYIPGATGVGGSRAGGETSPMFEYLFEANEKIIIEITNGSSAANVVSWKIKYYEED